MVPKREIDYLFDMPDSSLAEMMVFAKRVANNIREHIECARVAVAVIGLEVPHAHIHLIPIDSESDFNFRNPKLSLTDLEFREIQTLIQLK
ncbi:hypothetical protein FACS1894159_05820 [Bacteroidia bacterium]|nr:hypothetical protein FACS1894159_05820 [Bacteroidia bacterium]